MRARITGAMCLLLVPLAGGCLDTSLPEGFITCEATSDCPTGWSCRAGGRCYRAEDPSALDTDGDGLSDELERYAGTDPMDPGSVPPDAYVVVPYGSEGLLADVLLRARLARADVVFLVDTRSFMSDAIADLRGGFDPRFAPRVDDLFAKWRLGLAEFSGLERSSAAWFRAPLSDDAASFRSQLGMLLADGGDEPYACAPEAIYRAIATQNPNGTYGEPQFDGIATPILVLVSNSTFENGPSIGVLDPSGADWGSVAATIAERNPAFLAVEPLPGVAESRYDGDFIVLSSHTSRPTRYARAEVEPLRDGRGGARPPRPELRAGRPDQRLGPPQRRAGRRDPGVDPRGRRAPPRLTARLDRRERSSPGRVRARTAENGERPGSRALRRPLFTSQGARAQTSNSPASSSSLTRKRKLLAATPSTMR